MNKSRIYLSTSHQGGAENGYIQEALLQNSISTGGEQVNGFEEDLEQYLGQGSFVAGLNSGTSAIHLGLVLLGVQAGDEVLCQSFTFSASANPILYQGATPVFIDSEAETWNLCPNALEKAIKERIAKGKKPKAIIAVHLYGVPYHIEAIHRVANEYEIPVLEDAAEALGSSYKGQLCGTFGALGVLSFNGNKIITTSGGGAVISKSKEIKEKAVFYATQSRDLAAHYQHSEIGYNYRMSNICAAIGRGQIQVLDKHVTLRRKMHEFYVSLFAEIPSVTVFTVPNEDFHSNYWLTTILVEPNPELGISAEGLRLAFEQENVESRPLWKPMHLQPVFENYPYYGNAVSQSLFEKGLCLPSSSNLTVDEKVRIERVISSYFRMD